MGFRIDSYKRDDLRKIALPPELITVLGVEASSLGSRPMALQ